MKNMMKWGLLIAIPGGLVGAGLYYGYQWFRRVRTRRGFYILPALTLFLACPARPQTPPVSIQQILTSSYQEFNRAWFDNKLPSDTTIVYVSIPTWDKIGNTDRRVNANGSVHFTLFVNAYYDRDVRESEFTELHEMCHIRESLDGDEFDSHGPKWQACMLQLAMNGALENLW